VNDHQEVIIQTHLQTHFVHRKLILGVLETIMLNTNRYTLTTANDHPKMSIFTDSLRPSDRHNNGHITRQHFRQCLRILEMSATETEMQAVEARFCDDVGFHYSRFLEELDPNPKTEMMYVKRIQNLRVVNDDKKAKEDHPVGDLESVLKKVKTMVRLMSMSCRT